MKHILRQLALTTLCFGLLYGVVLGFTFLVMPDPPRVGWLDLETSSTTPYRTATKHFFLARDVLDVPDQKVLLIGASNTLVGFRKDPCRRWFPAPKSAISPSAAPTSPNCASWSTSCTMCKTTRRPPVQHVRHRRLVWYVRRYRETLAWAG